MLGKLRTTSLRLNNNKFTTLNGFSQVIEAVLEKPGHLNWIDLSFNQLTLVEKVRLANQTSPSIS